VKGAPLGIKMLGPRLRLLEQRTALPPQKPTDAFYSTPEWRALLAEIIAERGRVCEDPNCERTTPLTRIFGDHIVELRDGGTQLDKRNVMLRCGSCHTRKTVAERARRTAARV
jgi:5-methylcytosine-specific restriction endonuclease McrA